MNRDSWIKRKYNATDIYDNISKNTKWLNAEYNTYITVHESHVKEFLLLYENYPQIYIICYKEWIYILRNHKKREKET